MLARTLGGMSRRTVSVVQRMNAIGQHMMSTAPESVDGESPVLFESNLSLRKYILNRPQKLNALNETMLNILRPQIEEWSQASLCGTIVGTGVGRGFCVGGDVASIVLNAQNEVTRPKAIDFFKREFELDLILAKMKKPYVVIMDGITMGGGVGLSFPALFRVATENTVFAMPETKIGYFPDVGGSYFLSRLDGEIGTYLALTGDTLKGRQVFEVGIATHYIPARRIPILLERLSVLENPTPRMIDSTIEEMHYERGPEEPAAPFIGAKRVALDSAFRHNQVEQIVKTLQDLTGSADGAISEWAKQTLASLDMRSPTSLKVSLRSIRWGKEHGLQDCLQKELEVATAFCNGATPDFHTGVTSVLRDKKPASERPAWSPSTLEGVSSEDIDKFFEKPEFTSSAPVLSIPENLRQSKDIPPARFALPTEEEIAAAILGSHSSSGQTAITLAELLSKFEKLRPGKHGVKEKILEIVDRKCGLADGWLKWKH